MESQTGRVVKYTNKFTTLVTNVSERACVPHIALSEQDDSFDLSPQFSCIPAGGVADSCGKQYGLEANPQERDGTYDTRDDRRWLLLLLRGDMPRGPC